MITRAGIDRPVLRRDRITDGNLAGAAAARGQISSSAADAMQTTPAFVYLVPIVMLFGTVTCRAWW